MKSNVVVTVALVVLSNCARADEAASGLVLHAATAARDETGVSPDIRARILGADTDNDGVRDDVDEAIARTYDNPNERRAAIQFARAQTLFLLAGKSGAAVVAAMREVDRAMTCARSTLGPNYTAHLDSITATLLDSKDRWDAYVLSERTLAGRVVEAYSGVDACL